MANHEPYSAPELHAFLTKLGRYEPGIPAMIQKYMPARVLVGCHGDKFDTHPLRHMIEQETTRVLRGRDATYETTGYQMEYRGTMNIPNADYPNTDLFGAHSYSRDYMERRYPDVPKGQFYDAIASGRRKPYDVVWLPDCTGPWTDMQRMRVSTALPQAERQVLQHEANDYYLTVMLHALALVAPGGHIFMGNLPPSHHAFLQRFRDNFVSESFMASAEIRTLHKPHTEGGYVFLHAIKSKAAS